MVFKVTHVHVNMSWGICVCPVHICRAVHDSLNTRHINASSADLHRSWHFGCMMLEQLNAPSLCCRQQTLKTDILGNQNSWKRSQSITGSPTPLLYGLSDSKWFTIEHHAVLKTTWTRDWDHKLFTVLTEGINQERTKVKFLLLAKHGEFWWSTGNASVRLQCECLVCAFWSTVETWRPVHSKLTDTQQFLTQKTHTPISANDIQ